MHVEVKCEPASTNVVARDDEDDTTRFIVTASECCSPDAVDNSLALAGAGGLDGCEAAISVVSDGSAALLFMSAEKAKELGLKPLTKVHTAVLAGADPVIMLTAPIPATQKALKRSGLRFADIGVFEVNEAFAPVPLAWLKDIGADEKSLNLKAGRSRWVTRSAARVRAS